VRRLLSFALATGLLAAVSVGLASASGSAPSKKGVTPSAEAANAYLPAGVTPCSNDWPVNDCDLAGTDFSQLTQINKNNVGNLKVAWQATFETLADATAWPPQNKPIVVSGAGKNLPLASGTMFLPTRYGMKALDPTNGNILWSYNGPPIDPVTRVAGRSVVRTDRSEAYGNGLVFVGQQDRSIVALDSMTGKAVWSAQLGGVGTFGEVSRQASTATVLFYNDGKDGMLIAATNGGDAPLRGFEDAYDAKTGKLLWRFYNTPDPTQVPFIYTWGNPANAAFGGVTIWQTPVIDPTLGLVYFDLGNLYPETGRAPGSGLWSDSLVAVDLKTGKLKWYFQSTHHDQYDYDCSSPPVLINTTTNGKPVKAIAVLCKNGYLWVLNRANGSPAPNFPVKETAVQDTTGGKGAALNSAYPTQPVPVGAAAQIANHCPTVADLQAAFPSYPTAPNGTPIVPACPMATIYNDAYRVWGETGNGGYQTMSFDPQTNDLYVCSSMHLIGHENVSPVDYNTLSLAGVGPWVGSMSAVNMSTNKMDWQIKYGPAAGYCYSGVVSTASGLAFTATQGAGATQASVLQSQGLPIGGVIYAYDAKTGNKLWSWQSPGPIYAPPITYMVKGKQYLAWYVTSANQGDLLTVFSL
jgi:quinohemoprotein ethanol dehydrogenase